MAVVVQNTCGAVAFEISRGRRNVKVVLTTEAGYRGLKEIPVEEFEKGWFPLACKGVPYPPHEAAQMWLASPLVLTAKARRELEMIVVSNAKGVEIAGFADDQLDVAKASCPEGGSIKQGTDPKEMDKMAKKQTEGAKGAVEGAAAAAKAEKPAKVADTKKYKAMPLAEGAKAQKDSERTRCWQFLTDNGPQTLATLAEKVEGMTAAKVKAAISFLVATKKVTVEA